MTTFLLVNGKEYPATFDGLMRDTNWDNRESKTINLTMTYAEAIKLFVDDLVWSIKCYYEPADPSQQGEIEIFDNSDFKLAGDITDHRDGTISAKMGKLTDLEETLEIIYGGINEQ